MKNMNCFCFHLHVRQHTLAFIPSSGKIDSFGLGGNGQLGTRSTCNRLSPAPVKGCWRAHTDPVPMEVGGLTLSTWSLSAELISLTAVLLSVSQMHAMHWLWYFCWRFCSMHVVKSNNFLHKCNSRSHRVELHFSIIHEHFCSLISVPVCILWINVLINGADWDSPQENHVLMFQIWRGCLFQRRSRVSVWRGSMLEETRASLTTLYLR